MKKRHKTPHARLEHAKALLKTGQVVIGNEAIRHGPDAVVAQTGYRRGIIVLQWSRPGIGFGELTLKVRDGKLWSDREGMGLASCLDIIQQALMEGGEL